MASACSLLCDEDGERHVRQETLPGLRWELTAAKVPLTSYRFFLVAENKRNTALFSPVTFRVSLFALRMNLFALQSFVCTVLQHGTLPDLKIS